MCYSQLVVQRLYICSKEILLNHPGTHSEDLWPVLQGRLDVMGVAERISDCELYLLRGLLRSFPVNTASF